MKGTYLIFLLLLTAQFTFNSCSDDPLVTEIEEVVPEEMEEVDEMDDEDSDLDDAPAFSLKTFDDNDIKLSDYEDKNLVIFFFGNRCGPCMAVAPDIESQLNQAFGDKEDFAIIGIDQWDGNAASVENFQEQTGVTFPLALEGSPVAKDFGTTYDRLVVVKANGKIAYRGTSIAANNLEDVINLMIKLLD